MNIRVLVVDDQEPFRSAARAVVEHLDGFDIVGEAGSGEGAVSLVDELDPDLVLMDVNMGGIDGIEATAQILRAHPGVVVVLLSTYDVADLPSSARESGAVAYINKEQFDGAELRRIWAGR